MLFLHKLFLQCITNMKRTTLLTLLSLFIARMWVMQLCTEQANEHPISKANEVLVIEVNILWNSTFINSSAQALLSTSEVSCSPNLVEMTSVKVSTASSNHNRTTATLPRSLEAWSSINSSLTDNWGLTDSAPTATSLSVMLQTNGSLWVTDVSQSIVQASSSSFSRKSSARKVSEETVGLLVTLCCVTEIFI